MNASEFVATLRKKFASEFEIGGDAAIANRLGLSAVTLQKWSRSNEPLEPYQITNTLLKAIDMAVAEAQYDTIKPIVEFYPIDCAESKQGAKYELLPQAKDSTLGQKGLREELASKHGLYIFYDSRGRALYAGKAKKQTLWKEMNLAFNRARDEVQSITLVRHPERNQAFKPAYAHPRQPTSVSLELNELAYYFSAYAVTAGMIDDLEALLVRGFANDLLNIKMEKFDHFG
jgi:hypothetical protein